MENFLKYRPVGSLEPYQTSIMELLSENRKLPSAVCYFCGNAPTFIFHRVLNVTSLELNLSDTILVVNCMYVKACVGYFLSTFYFFTKW